MVRYYVRMGALDGYTDLIEQMGVDPFALMARVNILPAQTGDPDLMIPYETLGQLLELTAYELRQPCLGARISRLQGLSTVGLVGAFMAQQDSVEQALQCAQKFSAMHAQGVELSLSSLSAEFCEVAVEMKVNQHQQYPQLAQLSLGLLEGMLREMVGKSWRAEAIRLRQRLNPRLQSVLEYVLGCHVETGAASDSLVFGHSVLHSKPGKPLNLLEKIIEKQFRQQQLDRTDHKRLIRHAINVLLPTGDCSKENIAASLGMHPKKLERALVGQGTSYRELLEETRKEIALRTLKMGNLPMITLALNLGYADFSSFSRSFKRWTGMAPSHYLKSPPQS